MKLTQQTRFHQAGLKVAHLLFVGLLAIAFSSCTGFHSSNGIEAGALPPDIPKTWSFEHQIENTPMSHSILSLIRDSEMRSFVEVVMKNNPDNQTMLRRLKAQEYRSGISSAALWPSLLVNGSTSKNNQTPNLMTGEKGLGRTQSLGLGLQWEVDLWGKLRDQAKADKSSLWIARWQYYSALDALISRAIQGWIRSVSLSKSLAISKARVETLETILERATQRYAGGVGEISELDSAKTRLLLARVELQEVEIALRESQWTLEAIAGEYVDSRSRPEAVSFLLPTEGDINADFHYPLIEFPSILTPSEALFIRPDVQMALAQIDASIYQERYARKEHLPSLLLGGNWGKESIRFEDLLDSANVWNWVFSISKSLFDGGAIKNQQQAAKWERLAAVTELKGIVTNAVLEIRSRIALGEKLDRQLALLEAASQTASNSYQYYARRYQDGLDPMVLMLNAKEEQFSISAQLNETHAARLINQIETILALGYGVRNETDTVVSSDGEGK